MIITLKCPKCGESIEMNSEKGFVYCTNCGEKISFGEPNKIQMDSAEDAVTNNVTDKTDDILVEEQKNKSKRKKPIWTFVFGLVALIIAIIDWYLDPWWVNPIVAAVAIVLAIVSLTKRFRLRGFAIAAIPIAAIAGIIGIISAFVGPDAVFGNHKIAQESNIIEKISDDTKFEYGGISFTIPGEFGSKSTEKGDLYIDRYTDASGSDTGIFVLYTDGVDVYSKYNMIESFYDECIDAVPDDFDGDAKITGRKIITIDGVECKEFGGNIYDNNKIVGDLSGLIIYNKDTDSFVMVYFIESKDIANSYKRFYDSLVNSIKIKKSGNGNNTSVSTGNSSANSGSVDPDLKKFLDEYEEFTDEYVRIVKAYNSGDSTDYMSLLSDYLTILEKYSDFAEKLEKWEAKSNSFSDADLKYYTEVINRCATKLLSVE